MLKDTVSFRGSFVSKVDHARTQLDLVTSAPSDAGSHKQYRPRKRLCALLARMTFIVAKLDGCRASRRVRPEFRNGNARRLKWIRENGNPIVAALTRREIEFCMPVDARNWKCVTAFARRGKAERVVTLAAPARDHELARTPTTVRLLRDVTPSGRVRVLMILMLDNAHYPVASFGALYHQRWHIEEALKCLKRRLRLEAVTGLDYLALQQDIGAKIFADNLSILFSDLDAAPDDGRVSRANRVYALGGCTRAHPRRLSAAHPALSG